MLLLPNWLSYLLTYLLNCLFTYLLLTYLLPLLYIPEWLLIVPLLCVKDSAINMQEIEEALVIVKQRQQARTPELEFLQKVDEEQHKGEISELVFLNCYKI